MLKIGCLSDKKILFVSIVKHVPTITYLQNVDLPRGEKLQISTNYSPPTFIFNRYYKTKKSVKYLAGLGKYHDKDIKVDRQ